MKEIEVKFLEVDVADIKKKLKSLKAKRVFGKTLFQSLHFEHKLLGEKYFSLFRLRLEGKKLVLAAKTTLPGGRFKMEEEREIHLDADMASARKFLEAMGFEISKQQEKIREEYKIGNMKVEIDQYPRMKPYVEIEGPSQTAIRSLAKKLGFDFKDANNETATTVIKKAGLNPKKLLFK